MMLPPEEVSKLLAKENREVEEEAGYPRISDDEWIQSDYLAMRLCGQSHNMAEILALQQSPGIKGTDSQFWDGKNSGNHLDKLAAPIRDFYLAEAKKRGVDTAGKVYTPSLARFPGDPEAWIGGRSDIKKLAEKYNHDVSGAVEHRMDTSRLLEQAEKNKVDIAPDIVERAVQKEIKKDPEKARKLDETRAEVKERLTPHYNK